MCLIGGGATLAEIPISADNARQFVIDYHDALTAWFSGSEPAEPTWDRLATGLHADFRIVFPSGSEHDRDGLLENLRGRHGSAPGFVARISHFELVADAGSWCVVAYREHQSAATQSDSENTRSSLAVLQLQDESYLWQRIQETASP